MSVRFINIMLCLGFCGLAYVLFARYQVVSKKPTLSSRVTAVEQRVMVIEEYLQSQQFEHGKP